MGEFQELIRDFHKIREYMRQFFIYGFQVRGELGDKSARTYDNERRRVESWLKDYARYGFTERKKHVYISVDAKSVPCNPLYAAWKSKSFTDNDVLLHFFLLDLLARNPQGLGAGELADQICEEYGLLFDSQTVRLKLKEYEGLGLLQARRKGKSLLYSPVPALDAEPLPIESFRKASDLWSKLLIAVQFFQGSAPFGFVGSTILDREDFFNDLFSFGQNYIVHTLEDGILHQLLEAIRENRTVTLEYRSQRSQKALSIYGVPLKIPVSTRTGRRYVCLYLPGGRRFANLRLDCISRVKPGEIYSGAQDLQRRLERCLPRCWGVSFGGNSHGEELCIRLFIEEGKEDYILRRLQRERRGGSIERLGENEYLYRGIFYDTGEMLSWVKTFTGRILEIRGDNRAVVARALTDWERMYRLYSDG